MSATNKNPRCVGCNKFLFKVHGQKKKIEIEDEATNFSNKLQRTIVLNDILCSKCRVFQYKRRKFDVDSSVSETRSMNQFLMIQQSLFDSNLKWKNQILRELKFQFKELFQLINTVVFVLPQRISQLFQKKLECNLIQGDSF